MNDQIKRRDALHTIGVAAASVASLPWQAPQGSKNVFWAQQWILWRNWKERKIPLIEVLEDVHAAGYEGIELTDRGNQLQEYGITNHDQLRSALEERNLCLVARYYSAPWYDKEKRNEIIAGVREQLRLLRFFNARNLVVAGGGRAASADPLEIVEKSAALLNEAGRIAVEEGLQVGFHPHAGTTVEKENEIHCLMEYTEPRFVNLSPDVGHIMAGGGNVLEIIRMYKDRIHYFHFKDTKIKKVWTMYDCTDLGKGEIDFIAIMKLLKEISYRGWITIEQDYTYATPKESSDNGMEYIKNKLMPIYT